MLILYHHFKKTCSSRSKLEYNIIVWGRSDVKEKCKFNVKHGECLCDQPNQRLMIKCLTIIWSDQQLIFLLTLWLKYGRYLGRLRRRRRRAYASMINACSHNKHEKINAWVSFTFLYGYGAPFGGPSAAGAPLKNTPIFFVNFIFPRWIWGSQCRSRLL